MRTKRMLCLALSAFLTLSVCSFHHVVNAQGIHTQCTCTQLCEEGHLDEGCKVCNDDYTNCTPTGSADIHREDPAELDISAGSITIREDGYQVNGGEWLSHTGGYRIIQSADGAIGHSITVESGTIAMTVVGLNITTSDSAPISVKNGAVLQLKIEEDTTLNAGSGHAGISVEACFSDDVGYEQERSGHLIVEGEGTLTVNGGDAASGKGFGAGAGIGGDGYGPGNETGGDFGVVEIRGANILATGGKAVNTNFGAGAGIGGGGGDGTWTYAGKVWIRGGEVQAKSGAPYSMGNLGNYCGAAGIGNGASSGNDNTFGDDLDIMIEAGTVTAEGAAGGAGIGGSSNGGSGDIVISGGWVRASGGVDESDLMFGGAGIGSGDNVDAGSIILRGDAVVEAFSSSGAAAIGAGYTGYARSIQILERAQVTAVSTYCGAAIGSGYRSYTNARTDMEIICNTQGTITAYGNAYAQAIGRAGSYSGNTVTITVGEDSGPIWMFNENPNRSPLWGITPDQAQPNEDLRINGHALYWQMNIGEAAQGSASSYHADGTAAWTFADDTLSVLLDGDVIGQTFVDPAHQDLQNWAFLSPQQANEPITLRPVDLSIYTGGKGYSAVVDDNGEIAGESSLPKPLFMIEPDCDQADAGELWLVNEAADLRWKAVVRGKTTEGIPYYELKPEEGSEEVRIRYTDEDGNVRTSSFFDPEAVGDFFTSYAASVYLTPEQSEGLQVQCGSHVHPITWEEGTLTVRAVADVSLIAEVQQELPQEPLTPGTVIGIEATDDMAYTINDTGVAAGAQAEPSLLYDEMFPLSDDEALMDALIEQTHGHMDLEETQTHHHEAKYLSLVDADNANTWLRSDGGLDIYWAYPEGTDEDTTFELLHFPDIHREGERTGYEAEDMENSSVEVIQVTNTPYGIRFHIDHNGFSPFVLTWEEAQEEVDARGDLRIRLEGDALQTEETVGIRVQLSDPSVNGTYGDLTFVEGVAETRLAAHATVVAADLPASLRYQVTVPDAPDGRQVMIAAPSGMIEADQVQDVVITLRPSAPDTAVDPDAPGTDDDTSQNPSVDTAAHSRSGQALWAFWTILALVCAGSAKVFRQRKR